MSMVVALNKTWAAPACTKVEASKRHAVSVMPNPGALAPQAKSADGSPISRRNAIAAKTAAHERRSSTVPHGRMSPTADHSSTGGGSSRSGGR